MKKSSSVLLITFIFVCLFFTGCVSLDTNRSYILCLPQVSEKDYSNTKLIVMFHGYGGSASDFKYTTGFEKDASARDYAVVYIDGIPKKDGGYSAPGWNTDYTSYGKEEIGYVKDLIKYLRKEYGFNQKTYAAGFSNGGFFINKLACEEPELFDAVASVGGMMQKQVWEKKPKKTPVRFLQINGTKDEVVPMRLNDTAKFNPNPAMEDVIEYFAADSRIVYEPVTEKINSTAVVTKYGNKAWWVLISGFHHSWPNGINYDDNLNKVILDFFECED